MRRFSAFTVSLLIFICAVSVQAHADIFIDECDRPQQTSEKTYVNFIQNFEDFAAYSAWNSCGDTTALSMTANKAWVIYHISDADELFVELYSDGGTFATVDQNNHFQVGLTNMSEFSSAHRCRYQQTNDKVYLSENGTTYSLQCGRSALGFIEDTDSFSKDDPYYGVNAEISVDGVHYRPLELHFDSILWQNYENFGNFFKEFYSSSLPADTAYIKLTLYGYNRIPGDWGAFSNYPFLSKVKITRAEPVPSSSEEPSSSESSSTLPEEPSSSESSSTLPEEPSSSESTFSESSRIPTSHGSPDSKKKHTSLSDWLILKKSERAGYYRKGKSLEREKDTAAHQPSINTPPPKSDVPHDLYALESESVPLDPLHEAEPAIEEQEPSPYSLLSLYEEKPNESKEIMEGLVACGLTVCLMIGLFFLLKPHKS